MPHLNPAVNSPPQQLNNGQPAWVWKPTSTPPQSDRTFRAQIEHLRQRHQEQHQRHPGHVPTLVPAEFVASMPPLGSRPITPPHVLLHADARVGRAGGATTPPVNTINRHLACAKQLMELLPHHPAAKKGAPPAPEDCWTCQMCLKSLTEDIHVVLPCGHKLHAWCMENVLAFDFEHGKAHHCPYCLTEFVKQRELTTEEGFYLLEDLVAKEACLIELSQAHGDWSGTLLEYLSPGQRLQRGEVVPTPKDTVFVLHDPDQEWNPSAYRAMELPAVAEKWTWTPLAANDPRHPSPATASTPEAPWLGFAMALIS